jgi:hypothetical protein
MTRRHPVAVAIKQHAGEEAGLVISCARVPLGDVAGKLSLDRVPQRLIDDRRVLAEQERGWVDGEIDVPDDRVATHIDDLQDPIAGHRPVRAE